MLTGYIVFENIVSFRKQFSLEQDFYLIFEIGTENDKYLKQAVRECIAHDMCKGIVFDLGENWMVFGKLFFLRSIIEQLLFASKKVSLSGVPPCVHRTLLGGYLYMRFRYNQVPNFTNMKHVEEETYLPMCESCFDKEICSGPASMDMSTFSPVIKRHSSVIPKNQIRPFGSDLVYLNAMHEAYVLYCQQTKSSEAYRTVYYVNNIDFNSEHSYANRFVYGCDYPGPAEYAEEFTFLKEHVIHKQYIDLLESIASIEKTSQIAYSLAQKGEVFRESFYMFVSKQYGDKILQDFKVHYKYPESLDMQFIGIGVDVISNEIEGYKLYFQSTKSFLKRYLEPYGIAMSSLTHNSHYVVLRLNREQHFVSYKIEILIVHEDLKYFKDVIDDYDYFDEQLKQKGLYNIAIEIVEERISKINIYHRHYFTESTIHDI